MGAEQPLNKKIISNINRPVILMEGNALAVRNSNSRAILFCTEGLDVISRQQVFGSIIVVIIFTIGSIKFVNSDLKRYFYK